MKFPTREFWQFLFSSFTRMRFEEIQDGPMVAMFDIRWQIVGKRVHGNEIDDV